MERVILHCDLNNFYASVEALHQPQYRHVPMAVGGDVEKRHGIILAKNPLAKKAGVQTGEALWQARQKCPDIVILPPRFSLYLRFSKMVKAIYGRYSDRIESFGIDECWVDVTESVRLFGSGAVIADEIREAIKREVGITASIGVSFNKIFAKLGSDYKKPDATTVITRENMEQIIYPLPASDLLYVGRSTARKLEKIGVYTIGDLAKCNLALLKRRLGKWGEYLHYFANGEDHSPVIVSDEEPMIKSIGNSTTAPKDMVSLRDVSIVTTVLCESVASRLRDHQFKATVVTVYIRNKELESFTRQVSLEYPTDISRELITAAMNLFSANVDFRIPLRSIGIKASGLLYHDRPIQLSLFVNQKEREKELAIDHAFDQARRRFGFYCIQRGCAKEDTLLSGFNPKADHVIFPESYFKAGDH
ncbi:MAG TPA: DNA polymerase IV [Erysipelotrichaceae bacterium]|nr:DNA polymerase IV [Erysipelotrichaceae bacterium]